VLETVTLVSAVAARAVQISLAPNWVAARCTRVHVRPAPEMVSDCALAAAGPSEAAKATSRSPGVAMLNAAVVRLPSPSEKIRRSTVGTPTTGAGPLEMTRAIAVDGATDAPAAGFSLITDPAGTVALFAVVVAPTLSPAAAIADCALACVRPTTFGTVTSAGPSETVNATGLDAATDTPNPGLWLSTCPAGAAEFIVLTVPTVSPAPRIAACASACVSPMMFGTVARLRTVTVTGADVAVLPAASRATALSACAPSVTSDVCQAAWNGALTTSAICAPPSKKVTPTTPTLSPARALTVTVPETTAPLSGAAMLTVGATTSAVTVTLTMPIVV
jgi:hypothetical protein